MAEINNPNPTPGTGNGNGNQPSNGANGGQPDYEKKFSESSAEAQRLLHENNALKQKVDNLTKVETPTETELKASYPNWDLMTDVEKQLASDNLAFKKQIANQNSLVADMLEEQGFQRELAVITAKPEFAGIKGKEAEFKTFAYQKRFWVDAGSGRKIPVALDIIASTFLQENPPAVDPSPPTNPAPTLEPGSGGAAPGQTAQMTDEEKAQLRKNDPKRYNELLKKGLL